MKEKTRNSARWWTGGILVAVLALGPGCQDAKPPPSPKAAALTKEIQALIDRIAPPLIVPVSQRDPKAVQKALVKAFSVCAEACEGVFSNVLLLDHQGVLTAVYPPADVNRLEFANYRAVQKAFTERKPNQTILYKPDGTPLYIICVPLINNDQVAGLLALGFDGNQVRDKRGIEAQEFFALDFQAPRLQKQ